jgi:heptosyltransferase II
MIDGRGRSGANRDSRCVRTRDVRVRPHTKCETVVIGLNWVGDNVLALPTLRALQHRFRSEGGIAVAVPENVATLIEATGTVAEIVRWPPSMRKRIAELRAGRFRRAVILPNSFRAAFVAFAAGIPERWGYPTDVRRLFLTHPVARTSPSAHQLDDYDALLAALNVPHVVGDRPAIRLRSSIRERGKALLLEAGLHLDRPIFGIHAGGLFGRAKHWGDGHYIETIRRLRVEGYDVVLLTSPGERAQAERIATTCNGVPMVGHAGDVLDLAAAISHCAAIVTNDSGPLHVAAALGVPSVAVFGPTDPERTVIPGATQVIRHPMACQPCYQRVCPLGHHRCMSEIEVDEVFTAAVTLFPAAAHAERLIPRTPS